MPKDSERIVLINPPWQKRKGNIWRLAGGCMPPIGLASLAAYLERAGVPCRIIDANAEMLAVPEIIERLQPHAPPYVGITATTENVDRALELADKIKARFPKIRIVFGGVHATAEPNSVIQRNSIDYVIRGEAEQYLLPLVSGAPPADIPNLSFKSEGKIIHNDPGPMVRDLDSLPFPAYHLLPMHLYRPSIGNYKRLPAMTLMSSRGCPGRCTFCYVGTSGNRIRFRSAENIVDEIVHLQDHYGIREISFYDDNLTTSKRHASRLCQLLLDRRIDITWTCMSRVDTADEELFRLMKSSGCHQISLGIESADEQILKNIRKNIDLDQARAAIALAKKVGIDVKVFIMLGNPGETEESLRKSLQFVLETEPTAVILSIATPYPGTEFYRWAQENGYLKIKNWSDYDLSKTSVELPSVKSEYVEHFYARFNREFYLRPRYLLRRLLSIRSFHDIQRDFTAFRAVVGF